MAQHPLRLERVLLEVLCRTVLYARLHELQLSACNFTFCYIGSGLYTDAQTLWATVSRAYGSAATLMLVH